MALTFYLGELVDPGPSALGSTMPKGDVLVQRDLFLAAISDPATCTFETVAPAFDIVSFGVSLPEPQSGVTITFTGTNNTIVYPFPDWDAETGYGRYNTTPGGANVLQFRDDVTMTFSQPVSAVGLYGMDWGDFEGNVNYTLTDTLGQTTTGAINQFGTEAGPAANGNLLFWGFTDDSKRYASVKLFCTYDAGPPPVNERDYFGIDDIIVGAVTPLAVAVPEPQQPRATIPLTYVIHVSEDLRAVYNGG